MPFRAIVSEPFPAAFFPAPGPGPFILLPEPLPRAILVPLPVAPRPGLSAPAGDIASEPAPPLLGNPTFDPGWLERTAPAFASLPPFGGAAAGGTASRDAPRAILRSEPDPDGTEAPFTEGGGATTLLGRLVTVRAGALVLLPVVLANEGGGATTVAIPMVGAADENAERVPVPAARPTDGGGATTLPRFAPIPLAEPRGLPPAVLAATFGGGGTILAASCDPVPLVVLFPCTDGGGGTTSLGPKILPIKLLMKEPLAVCVGGGGKTFFDESGMPLPERRRAACETSDGGGAITVAGKVSFGLRIALCSGAETGGGTTLGVICAVEVENSRVTPLGAARITFVASAGADREKPPATPGAGATTDGATGGETRALSREMRGAGGIAAGPRAGASNAWSPATFGAGGITDAL